MDLAVDTNVLLACFKPASITRRMIAIENLHLSTTEHQIEELDEYVREMKDRYNLSEDLVQETIFFIEEKIDIVPKEEHLHLIKKLEGAISDNDFPQLALATGKNFEIWSNDPHFKEQNTITVFTTSELLEIIKRGMV